MSKLVTKAVDGLSKIPGMAWVVAVVSYLYVQATGLELEESWVRILAITLACGFMYWAASGSDSLYKHLYDADRKHNFNLPFVSRLDRGRDDAAKAVFRFDSEVIDYKTAVARRYISTDPKKPGLYAYAKTVAKHSGDWEGLVTLLLDLSKASRTLSLAAAVAATGLWIGWISVPATVDSLLFRPGTLIVAAILLLLGGFVLRLAHQILLYKRIAPTATHAPLSDGRLLLVSDKHALENRAAPNKALLPTAAGPALSGRG